MRLAGHPAPKSISGCMMILYVPKHEQPSSWPFRRSDTVGSGPTVIDFPVFSHDVEAYPIGQRAWGL